jgi:hypothetical protein
MIKSLTVTNYLGESLVLELGFPEKSGFLVQSITGLGPGKANINISEVATNDGGVYNSSRIGARNIVITLGFLENPDIETTRQLSYKYFPLKKQVRLLFETDNRTCEIYGNVESNEPNIFSSQESTQISILCPDPYFYSTDSEVTVFSGIESLFEFPFSNESLTEDLIEFGEIKNELQTITLMASRVGIVITIHALVRPQHSIYNTEQEGLRIDTDRLEPYGFGLLWVMIYYLTITGSKIFCFLEGGGVYLKVINCLISMKTGFSYQRRNVFAYARDYG